MLLQHLWEYASDHIQRDVDAFTRTHDKDIVKCSYTQPAICQIECDRTTVTNSIYNNVNIKKDEDMMKQMKSHYRRHLRDEIDFLKRIHCKNICAVPLESLYNIKNINDVTSGSKRPLESLLANPTWSPSG